MAVAIDNKSAAIVAKYRTLFDVKEQQLNGQKNHPLQAIRRQAMDRLEDIGFPARIPVTLRNGLPRRIPLSLIKNSRISLL